MSDFDEEEDEAFLAISGVGADDRNAAELVFCRAYLETGDARQAVIRSRLVDSRYTLDVCAREILERPEIQAVLEVMRREGGSRALQKPVTRELVVDELQAIHDEAMRTGQLNSAISALKLQSQLRGYLADVVNVNHTVSVRELPLAELRRLAAERLGGTLPESAGARVVEGECRVVADSGGGLPAAGGGSDD